MNRQDRVIVALDVADLKQADSLMKNLKGIVSYYKIGLELFTSQSWQAVELVKKYDGKIFLDLKLHDIPNTVARSIQVVCEHEIDMVNIHTLGGFEMMKKAAETIREKSKAAQPPILLGVTILTSHTEEQIQKELGISRQLNDEVLSLAKLAQSAGLNGVVCSPQETPLLRKSVAKEFLLVTPGIRPRDVSLGDQKRVCTPRDAFEQGADYIVVGRPITEAKDPAKAARDILSSL